MLKDWRKCQWVRKELSRVDLLAPNAVVFSNEDGSVRTYSGTRRIFDRFAKRNGFLWENTLPYFKTHIFNNAF